MKSLRPQWTLISARSAQWTGRDSHIRDLLTIEADRVGYILKSYLRTRLFKIQKFSRHYLVSGQSLMSPSEVVFANHVVEISQKAFDSILLKYLPQGDEYFQSLTSSDDPGGEMVRKPNLERVVFVKVNDNIGAVNVGGTETVILDKDRMYIARYDLVASFLADHRIDLV